MTEHRGRRQRLVDELVGLGQLAPPWVDAFVEVPRHLFVPDTVWLHPAMPFEADPDRRAEALRASPLGPLPDAPLVPLHRADAPQVWLDLVYGNNHVVTQVDDGRPAGPDGRGLVATSSSSQPSVMAIMLRSLDAEPGHRVLEVGAGTGFNAALLAHRLGPANVTTVDVDPTVADAARSALAAAGFAEVTVITGDGELGHPDGAPYDRIICTAGVRDVPYAWVRQTRPGGRIVAPWSGPFFDGGLLVLTVDDQGGAAGRIVDRVGFMPLRGQRLPHPGGHLADEVDPELVRISASDLHPAVVALDGGPQLAAAVLVPQCRKIYQYDDELLWLVDPSSGSWASARPGQNSGRGRTTVRQYGPRRLWDEVESAYRWWYDAGRPGIDRWTFTVGPDGQSLTFDA